MRGKGFIRAAAVRVCSETISEDGCLLNRDDGVGEAGVRRDDGREDSVTSVTVCNLEDGLSPVTVVALVSRTFCVRPDCEARIVPDKDADLERWLDENLTDGAADSAGTTKALGDLPALLGVQIGLKAFGVSGNV
jgi:hypothetical protein